ncbi:hypothetical protein JMJ77_0008777, partial [Colletotrichum scovillei]
TEHEKRESGTRSESHAVKSLSDAFAVSSLLYRPSTVESSTNHIAQSQPLPALVYHSEPRPTACQTSWEGVPDLNLLHGRESRPSNPPHLSFAQTASSGLIPASVNMQTLFQKHASYLIYTTSPCKTLLNRPSIPLSCSIHSSTFGYPQIQLA